MSRHLQQHKWILFLLLIAALDLDCFAQPGNEHEYFLHLAATLQREIMAVTTKIAKRPNDLQLHEKRADLYAKLYSTTNESSYVRLSDVAPGLKPIDLVNAVIDDYSRIISTHRGQPEHFLKRGGAYALRWRLTMVDWDSTMRKHDQFWGETINWNDKARVRSVFKKYVTNHDFDLAIADLQTAAKGQTFEIEAEQRMGTLYLARPDNIPLLNGDTVRSAAESGIAGYFIWNDYDRAIVHLSKVRIAPDENRFLGSTLWPRYIFLPTAVQGAVLGKMHVAISYGRDKNIAEIFDRYLSWIKFDRANDDLVCEYYNEGLRAHVRLGNYDRVLSTVGKVLADDVPIRCEGAYEPRGDAYLGKGGFALAVADYNAAVNHPNVLQSDRALYIKRAKAFIGLGEKEKALADLNRVLPQGYSDYGLIEAHLLRASLLREFGNNKEAADDEKLANYMQFSKFQSAEHDREYQKRKGVLFGTVILPNGQPLYDPGGYASVKYSDGSQDSWWPQDEHGRFLLRLKPLPFTIFVVREENGIEVNYAAQPQEFPATTSQRGPIVITLSRSSGN